jgi:hypothetical protein
MSLIPRDIPALVVGFCQAIRRSRPSRRSWGWRSVGQEWMLLIRREISALFVHFLSRAPMLVRSLNSWRWLKDVASVDVIDST